MSDATDLKAAVSALKLVLAELDRRQAISEHYEQALEEIASGALLPDDIAVQALKAKP